MRDVRRRMTEIRSHRILIVDDFPDAAETACVLFALMGHECRVAFKGFEALSVALAFDPDIVILDIGLPDISGYEVARVLRERGNNRMHIVALTGWGAIEDRVRAFAAGFNQHVVKPADGGKLRDIVRAAELGLTSGPGPVRT
jgi:DNA-binding response OmpR family regulator